MLAEALGVAFVNSRDCEIEHEIVDLVPESFIRERRAMPLRSRPLPLLATKLQTG